MGNSLGRYFVVTCFGESHGPVIGVVIDGCPAGLALTEKDLQPDLDRRAARGVLAATPRREKDRPEILSGVLNGFTTGAPLCMIIPNENADAAAYDKLGFKLRPGHADFTAYVKYGGFNDRRGGGRFSGRLTAAFVMAGAVAKKLLVGLDVEILAHTLEIGGIQAREMALKDIRKNAPADPLACADTAASKKMQTLIKKTREDGDSLGGVIEGIALNLPAGLGEPVFDTLDGDISKAMFAIPAVKGMEFGAGFAAARLPGSESNDPFLVKNGEIVTATNNAGGVLGGISSGMPLVVRVAVKPVPSIALEQDTVDIEKMKPDKIAVGGRHDACIVPRAVPVVEAMLAVTLCDFALRAGKIPGVIK